MHQFLKYLVTASALIAAPCFMLGCDDDREVLDVDTPGADLEIEQDPDDGAVDVDVDANN